jgi:uncharacterized protein YukE
MAIYKKGADPVALRASAERITGHARECETVKGEASRAVHALKGQWGGGDLDHLMNRWPPIEAQLTQFGTDLGKLAEALRRNAGAQDTTSGQGSGGVGPMGAPGSGLPFGPGSPTGNGGSGSGDEGTSPLDGIANAMTIFGMPSLLAQTAAFGSVFSRSQGALMSGRYLSNITEMMRVGDSMLDVFPGASRFAAGANLFADAWDMKGLSGLFAEGSAAGNAVGKFGVLGPVGIGLSAAQLGVSIAEGDTEGIITNGLSTGLAAGAVFAPPPINIACGVAGLGVAAYQNIPAVHDAVNAVGEGIADVAGDIGDAASDAWDSVTSIF